MDPGAQFCQTCGKPVPAPGPAAPGAAPAYAVAGAPPGVSDEKRLLVLLLAIFFGYFGVHRFYVGKVGTGILWLCTLGFLGIGALVDALIIAFGEFTDSQGRKIQVWT